MTRGRSILGPRRALIGALTIGGLIASLFAAPTTLGASLDLAPTSGLPGASIKATATEFPPGPVEFLWDGTLRLGERTANAQGRAVLTFAIPAGAAPGQHSVVACSPSCAVSAQGTVTVTAAPTPTPPPTPVPTPVPTPRVTPTPRPPTPRPSVPGATTIPAPPTPVLSGSPVPSATASAVPTPFPTPLPVESASPPAPSEPAGAVGTPSPRPQGTLLPAGPIGGGDGSLVGVVVPIGAIGALILVGFLFARGRWRPALAPAGATAAGAMAAGARMGRRASRRNRGADDEPDAFSALHDPVAPFLEPVTPNGPTSERAAPTGPAEPAARAAPAALAEPAAPASAPPEAEPWSRARTISMHVEHIEADDA